MRTHAIRFFGRVSDHSDVALISSTPAQTV